MQKKCDRERETYRLYRKGTNWALQSETDARTLKRIPEGEFIAEFFPTYSIYTHGDLLEVFYKFNSDILGMASGVYIYLPEEDENV